MEASQPGSSSTGSASVIDLTSESDETYGIETLNLLRQVVQGIHNEIIEPDKALEPKFYLERAARFTGFNPECLKTLDTSDTAIYMCKEIDRKRIYAEIVTYCLLHKRYPNCVYLFNVLRNYIPPYIDKQTFFKLLIKMGYIFKKDIHNNTPGVVERTEITFERYLYLNNIQSYRNSNRNIYYIGEASASLEGRVFNLDETEAFGKRKTLVRFMFIISGNSGLLDLHIVNEFNYDNFQYWILKEVIPKLTSSSIIVFDNSKHHNAKYCTPPALNSLKQEITEWLEHFNVPYSKSMSKVQLLELVEKFTDTEANVYVIDNILKENGHTVLRLPDCINDLSLAAGVRHLISINSILDVEDKTIQNIQASLRNFGENKLIKELKLYNSSLIQEEINLLSLDMKFETVREEMESADKLKYLSADDSYHVDSELPYFSDSE